MLIGRISGSSLAVAGIASTAFTVILATFSVLTNGSAILTARLIGANENHQASEIVEQSIFFSAAGGIMMAVLFEIFTFPIVHILMPNADSAVINEAVTYIRVMALSFPLLLLFSVISNIMRSSGNSVMPMIVNVTMNLIQLLTAFPLIKSSGMTGVGISFAIARIYGVLFMFIAVLRSDRDLKIKIANLFLPKISVFGRIAKIGFPISVESTLVQGGYLIANIMAVGLGVRNATTYQVSNTVNTFFSLPQNICATISMITAGMLIGAKRYEESKKLVLKILFVCLSVSLAICVPLSVIGKYITAVYSSDPDIISASAKMLWILILVAFPAVIINSVDPALRSGGDSKFVMGNSILGVWLFRLPFTYLFCYIFKFGVIGIFLGNLIGLSVRATISMFRLHSGKWLHKTI